jgi:hypothetical protein
MRFCAVCRADAHSTLMLARVAEEERMQRKAKGRAARPVKKSRRIEEDLRLGFEELAALCRFAPASSSRQPL